MPSAPLRHNGVIAKSERVYVNGQLLVAGTDYTMDYDSGVVYLLGAGHGGQTISVSYRYTPGKTTATNAFANGVNAFQLSLLPGAVNMRFGFGLAERESDGSVLRSNIYGLNTNYKFGMFGGKSMLNGLMLFGNRQEVASTSDYEKVGKKAANPTGASRLVLENLQTKVGTGNLSLDYQDVSKNFTGFAAAQGSGYDQKALDQLQKEKGLTRMGYGMTDFALGGLKLSNGYHLVQDDTSRIAWKSFGLKNGGFSFAWDSQQVSQSFKRFNDLGEANHADLQRELGTQRDNASLGLNMKKGAFAVTQFAVTDQTGSKLVRHDASLTGKNGTVTYGDSKVAKSFTGFGNLLDPERKVYGSDAGLDRQWVSATYDFGHGSKPLLVSDSLIKSATGKYRADDLSFGGKLWTFSFADHGSSSKFASFGAINQADTDANINAIAAMYPGVKPNAPAERGAFTTTPGLNRKDVAFGITPTKNSSLTVNDLTLKGATDQGKLQSASLVAGGLSGTVKYETTGATFSELQSLMGFEKGQLGTLQGLKKTDVAIVDNLGHNHMVSFNQMSADTPNGGAARETAEYKDRQLDVIYQSRSVDPKFASVSQLIDPQAPVLGSLIGFKQSDTKVAWAPGSGLTYAGQYTTSHDATTGVSTAVGSTNINLVRGGTSFNFLQNIQQSSDPIHLLLENDQQTMSLKEAIGNWTFHAARAKVDFGGTQEVDASGNPLQSYSSNTVGLELKLSKTTSVASELISTEFANGQQASIRTDSVSTALTPRAGITVSNTQIDNNADNKIDETKRNYGFWYDVAKGVRVSYGYVRDLNSGAATNSTLNSVLTVGAAPTGLTGDALGKVTPGTLGDLTLAGGYAANQWLTPSPTTGLESTRTQSFSNIRVSTIKPLAFGPLKELKFQINTDTATDNFTWIRQNQEFGFTGKLGLAAFGYDYHSQIDGQNERAVDRSYSFASDPSETRFFTGSVLYKMRMLPGNQTAMIRNFDVKLHPTKRLTLSNQLQTNPEVANANVILGSVLQGTQVNRYKADFASTKDVSFGASWEELKNTATKAYGQTTAINMSLFNSKNPILFSYGWQTLDGNVARQTIQRWSIKYDQKAGPNQSFNFMVGSLSYGFTVPTGQPVHGLTAQLGYQLHLK